MSTAMPSYHHHHLLFLSLFSSVVAQSTLSPLFSPAQLPPSPFLTPDAALPYNSHIHDKHSHALLFRRQSSCAASYTACTNVNAPNLCCQPSTHCTTDNAGHAACCSNGAICAGTLAGEAISGGAGAGAAAGNPASATAANPPAFSQPAVAPSAPHIAATVTITLPYGSAPSATAGNVLPGPTVTGAVPGAQYAWTYVPQTYANAGQCSSYYTSCSDTFASCTNFLGFGGGVGVTVQGMGVTTANAGGGGGGGGGGGVPGDVASAASVCSGLSTQACRGLQTGFCAQFGSANAGAGRPGGMGPGLGVVIGILGAAFA